MVSGSIANPFEIWDGPELQSEDFYFLKIENWSSLRFGFSFSRQGETGYFFYGFLRNPNYAQAVPKPVWVTGAWRPAVQFVPTFKFKESPVFRVWWLPNE